ncbi:hypothetical protein [Dermatobacter hominis]|uniref:hypothetical protein n=1 Tax=Dermatobacter hominis TaxID=2884263 RepID=UPI001D1272CB|nr:hypothetical protein [Dermatobacter hominis]UDY35414.1 hypothetical protein LH044_19045 [Dermatobacter hominis]
MSRRRRAATAAVATCALLAASVATASSAAAAGDGAASSRVTRDGRIITSILTGGTIRPRGGGAAPRTVWLTLTDAELAYLLQLVSLDPTFDSPLLDVLLPLAEAAPAQGADVQIRITDGRFDGTARLVPAEATAAPQVLARRMITTLPALPRATSPPVGAGVVVGEPVFTSFTDEVWATEVDRTLTAGGVTARVRAHPVGFTVRSGDPEDHRTVTCSGPGRPYDPDDPASARRQARRPGACTMAYRSATGVDGRRDRWYGDVTVIWRAEWTTDGATWRSLGDIPQISVVARRVTTASTAIESTG